MKRRAVFGFTAAVLVCLVASPLAMGAQIVFDTSLLGANEAPPVLTNGWGVGSFVVDTQAKTFDLTLTVDDLIGPVSSADIHMGLPGLNGPSVITLPALTDVTIPNTQIVVYKQLQLTNFSWQSVFPAFLTQLSQGNLYLNVHTTTFPGGEVRAQLPAVPEPSTIAMLCSGALMGAFYLWRRRK